MSNTVWVIETGEYSDYRVVGVFTTREAAETVRDAIGEGEIAEWPLDPCVAELDQGLKQFAVRMLRDGLVEEVMPQELRAYSVASEPWIWRRSQAPAYKDKGVPDALCSVVFAMDTQHAIKIVNEKRLQMIAMNLWRD